MPIFLDQLSARLRSGMEADTAPIGTTASLHGGELQKLGFTIKAAKAMDGTIHVRNVPGTGCVFTLDLARASA